MSDGDEETQLNDIIAKEGFLIANNEEEEEEEDEKENEKEKDVENQDYSSDEDDPNISSLDELIERGDVILDAEEEEDTAGDGEQEYHEDDADVVFSGHADSVYCASFSHSGLLVASGGGDDAACLWSPSSGELLARLPDHGESVVSVAFSADDRQLCTGALDGTLRLYALDGFGEGAAAEAATPSFSVLDGPSEGIEFLHWHPSAPALLVGAADGLAWLYDCSGGRGTLLMTLAGHEGAVACGRFSPSGAQVVTGGADGAVRTWSPRTGECLRCLRAGPEFHESGVNALALGAKALCASAGMDGKVCLASLATGRVLQVLRGHEESVECVEFGEFGEGIHVLASGGLDARVLVWDVARGAVRVTLKGHEHSVTALRWWGRDGHTLLSSSVDSTLRWWDVRSGECVKTLYGHQDAVLGMDLFHNSVVSFSDDHTCRIFSYHENESA